MITLYKTNESRVFKGKYFTSKEEGLEFRGLSTDEKPTTYDEKEIPNGSTFIEIDTGDLYMYDGEGQTWGEI